MELERVLRASPLLAPVLERWGQLGLPQGWLVAGAVAQTVWNHRFGLPAAQGISDVDIVYFDAKDLTAEGEVLQAERVRAIFADLPLWVDVKNEARVHLWYEAKFGYGIAPYGSVEAAIASFPTTATSLGVRPLADGMAVEAPFGTGDLWAGVVRANKALIRRAVYEAKVARWQRVWPGLQIVGWEDI